MRTRALLLPLFVVLATQPSSAGICELLCAFRGSPGSTAAVSDSGCPAHRGGPASAPSGDGKACPGHGREAQGALIFSVKSSSGSSALGWLGIFAVPDTSGNPRLAIPSRRRSERPLPSTSPPKSTILRL